MKSTDELVEAFRQKGLKVTPQRQRIFRCLHGNDGHPTAEEVYADVVADMPTISLRTVYQTLNDLVSMGEISELRVDAGPARFDPNGAVHHHLHCSRCGVVTDVYADTSSLQEPLNTQGFRIESTEVVFRGICERCARSDENHTQSDKEPQNA
jgi:Fe2+ or Zn2+ uptake regulation protein